MATCKDLVRALTLVDAAYVSAQTGQSVRLGHHKERGGWHISVPVVFQGLVVAVPKSVHVWLELYETGLCALPWTRSPCACRNWRVSNTDT